MTAKVAFGSKDELKEFIGVQFTRVTENLARAQGMVETYKFLYHLRDPMLEEKERVDGFLSDLLRSAVVLIHATLEDMLRSIASVLLPYSDEATLNVIPLVGTSGSGRAEKFFLGKLAAHREKSVLALIKESVDEHLLHATYNDTSQIATLLKSLDVALDKVQDGFPVLDALIKRRHQIVHRADRSQPTQDPQEKVQQISAETVEEWIAVATSFVAAILSNAIYKNRHGLEESDGQAGLKGSA